MITCCFYIYKNLLSYTYSKMRRDDMEFMEKIDILDFIIDTLKQHEKVLDELAYRLEACLKDSPRTRQETCRTPDAGKTLEDWR